MMSLRGRVVRAAVLALVVAGTAARAELLVLKSPQGQLFLTNRGEKAGYQVISRHREFFGSSGMGLYLEESRNAALYDEAVKTAAARFSLDPFLVKAVIRAESNFNAMAVSPKGAMGLMQLMPDTARQHAVRNAFDPAQNVAGGARHLRYLMNRYDGDLDLVLAAYNAGTKPVDAVNGIPSYRETQEYVRRVRLFHATYHERSKGGEKPMLVRSAPKPVVARIEGGGEKIYGAPILLRAASAH